MICLLKVYPVVPVICLYFPIVNTAVDVPVTGVSNTGELLPLSALLYCSSLDVKLSVLCSGSESELSVALNLQQFYSPMCKHVQFLP